VGRSRSRPARRHESRLADLRGPRVLPRTRRLPDSRIAQWSAVRVRPWQWSRRDERRRLPASGQRASTDSRASTRATTSSAITTAATSGGSTARAARGTWPPRRPASPRPITGPKASTASPTT
jgi:hypothetical protein